MMLEERQGYCMAWKCTV